MLDRRNLFGAAIGAGAAVTTAQATAPQGLRRGYASASHGQIHYRAVGEGRRPPLLCFHHVPNSGQIFERVAPALANGRRVVILDTPGYGMSDPLPDPQRIDAYAQALAEAAASLGLAGRPVDLLGYHTGAAIACEIALSGGLRVRRLALCAVPVFSAEERASFGAQTPIPFDEDGDWAREEWRRSWRWRGPGQTREMVLRTYAEKMRPGARERGAAAIAAYDMADALARVRQPMMILRPRDDLWEATGRAMALRPDAPAEELPDLGHGLWDVASDQMSGVIDGFLRA